MPNSLTAFPFLFMLDFPFSFEPEEDIITVAADTALDVQPPSGEEWVITSVGAEGDGSGSGGFYLRNVAADGRYLLSPFYSIGQGDLDYCSLNNCVVFVDNTTYFTLWNNSASQAGASYSGFKIKRQGEKGEVVSDIVSPAGSSSVDIKPPPGETWYITAISTPGSGSSVSGWARTRKTGYNGIYLVHRNHDIGEGDNTREAAHNLHALITETHYLQIYNAYASTRNGSYSGIRWK